MHTKNIKIITLVVLALITSIIVANYSSTVKADSGSTPGLADDPVVTKSYVDQKLAQLGLGGGGGGNETGAGTTAKLEVVKVPVGQMLIVNAGGELIVRTGKAVAFSSDTDGLSDMTDGVDITPGKPVRNNHLILFPREGRGVKHAATSKTELIVLVRGGYQVQ